jgi:ABC-type Mn2+/Zn2+ transport system ATPase subunit
MSDALLALEGAAIGYGRTPLLSGIDLAVVPGDFLAVVGPNGGGKTTLMRSLLGAQPLLAGRRVLPRPLRVGYVPQRDVVDAAWPFTAGEVALMGRVPRLGPLARPRAADRAAAEHALEQVGLAEYARRPFRDLSGGQRQRTLIARALAAEPELLVLDEPTSGMDLSAELQLIDFLRGLHAQGLAIVMVTHRIDPVTEAARDIAFVDRTQGLFRVGTTAQMLVPEALGALYGLPVTVAVLGGRRVVYPTPGATP